MASTQTQKFLDKVAEDKKEQLRGIAMDKAYWTQVFEKYDEDALRKELADAREADEMDEELVFALEVKINTIQKGHEEMKALKMVEWQIRHYFDFVSNPSKEVLEALDEVNKF